jgi:hypothetical protein
MIDELKSEYSLPINTGSEKFQASLLKSWPKFSVHKPSTANYALNFFRSIQICKEFSWDKPDSLRGANT